GARNAKGGPLLGRLFGGTPLSAATADASTTAADEVVTGTGSRQRFNRSPASYHSFYFTRAIYSDGGWRRRGSWAIDFPKADLQFLVVLRRLAAIDAYPEENAIQLDDPKLRRYPFLYMLEVGGMSLTPGEVTGLRDYLLAGGFLVVDDFWGTREWANFQYEISRVLPEYPIEELTLDHPIFSAYYVVKKILQVPSINNIRWGQTSECGACQPHVLGIHDENGRLMVIINWNTDLGDAWEWAEQPDYPLMYSTYAFQMGVNFIIYAMSH
ncbi:MAG: DUF4159 domain-containing protein, partial [Longimicrobiales bacterium]